MGISINDFHQLTIEITIFPQFPSYLHQLNHSDIHFLPKKNMSIVFPSINHSNHHSNGNYIYIVSIAFFSIVFSTQRLVIGHKIIATKFTIACRSYSPLFTSIHHTIINECVKNQVWLTVNETLTIIHLISINFHQLTINFQQPSINHQYLVN